MNFFRERLPQTKQITFEQVVRFRSMEWPDGYQPFPSKRKTLWSNVANEKATKRISKKHSTKIEQSRLNEIGIDALAWAKENSSVTYEKFIKIIVANLKKRGVTGTEKQIERYAEKFILAYFIMMADPRIAVLQKKRIEQLQLPEGDQHRMWLESFRHLNIGGARKSFQSLISTRVDQPSGKVSLWDLLFDKKTTSNCIDRRYSVGQFSKAYSIVDLWGVSSTELDQVLAEFRAERIKELVLNRSIEPSKRDKGIVKVADGYKVNENLKKYIAKLEDGFGDAINRSELSLVTKAMLKEAKENWNTIDHHQFNTFCYYIEQLSSQINAEGKYVGNLQMGFGGRFYADSGDVALSNISNVLKASLHRNHANYDIKSCHLSAMAWVLHQAGKPELAATVQKYVGKEARQRIADATGLSVDTVKLILLSLIYNKTIVKSGAARTLLAGDPMKLNSEEIVKMAARLEAEAVDLMTALEAARKYIGHDLVNKATGGAIKNIDRITDYMILNQKKVIPFEFLNLQVENLTAAVDFTSNRSGGSFLAFVLQGIEQAVKVSFANNLPADVQLFSDEHDGLVLSRVLTDSELQQAHAELSVILPGVDFRFIRKNFTDADDEIAEALQPVVSRRSQERTMWAKRREQVACKAAAPAIPRKTRDSYNTRGIDSGIAAKLRAVLSKPIMFSA